MAASAAAQLTKEESRERTHTRTHTAENRTERQRQTARQGTRGFPSLSPDERRALAASLSLALIPSLSVSPGIHDSMNTLTLIQFALPLERVCRQHERGRREGEVEGDLIKPLPLLPPTLLPQLTLILISAAAAAAAVRSLFFVFPVSLALAGSPSRTRDPSDCTPPRDRAREEGSEEERGG